MNDLVVKPSLKINYTNYVIFFLLGFFSYILGSVASSGLPDLSRLFHDGASIKFSLLIWIPLFVAGVNEAKLKLSTGFFVALVVALSLIFLLANRSFLIYFTFFLPFLLVIFAAALPPRNESLLVIKAAMLSCSAVFFAFLALFALFPV